MEVNQITRLKHRGKEYVKYGATLRSTDYRKNEIDFYETFGEYEMPKFTVQTDPNTDKVIPRSAQINGHESVYDIPFSKEKVKKLVDMASESGIGLTVVDQTGRRYSCNLNEFLNEDYDELVDKKSGFTEYLRDRKKQQQQQQ